MNIDVENLYSNEHRLNINEKLDNRLKMDICDLFEECYHSAEKKTQPKHNYEMKINLLKNEPFGCTPRKLSYEDKEILIKIIDDLLDKKIIRKSCSEYCSPIVLVKKKNPGERRLCCDYRRLNRIVARDNYPLPLIDELVEFLNEKNYFTSLDLKNGFWHLNLEENSKKFTSFVTPIGQFEWNKLPFGIKSGPAGFQRFISEIFESLIKKKLLVVYIDDILIATKTAQEHIMVLKEVFKIISENLLELRLDKCKWMHEEIVYLGYKINKDGVHPKEENIEAIKNFPCPNNIREVQRFIGMCSYFRKFVKDFSTIAKPLYDLIKNKGDFKFEVIEKKSFNELKSKLISAPVLTIYNFHAKTELHCDASNVGFGAVLLQEKEGTMHPVFYFSKRTTKDEANYHSFELECLAIIYALRRFKIYLLGKSFKIVTDCDSLAKTLEKQSINPRIARWALELAQFDYLTEHRRGNQMQHVDALSRIGEIAVVQDLSFEDNLAMIQSQDKSFEFIRKELETGVNSKFELKDGLIYRKINDNEIRFAVPRSMEYQVLKNSHDNFGHVGSEKTIEIVKRFYWFPNIAIKVKDYIANCLKCLAFNAIGGKKEGFLNSIEKGNKPFSTLHVDFYGPLERKRKFKYIFAIVDGFSKFIRFYPTKSTTTMEVVNCCREYFRAYSTPVRIISDRGTCFTSKDFKSFVEEKCIEHVLIAAGAPRANGQVERMNRTLTPMIAKMVDSSNNQNWVDVLEQVEFVFNNVQVKSTGEVPSKLLFGVAQKGEVNDFLAEHLKRIIEKDVDIDVIRNKASENIKKNQEYNETMYNKKRKASHKYNEGDLVLISNVDTSINVNKKLIPKFKGPYRIKKVLGNDRYIIKDIDGFQITNKPFESVFDVTRIKPYVKID